MPSDPVDQYDVESMIRNATTDLRAEFEAEIRELRDELGTERVERQDADDSLERLIASRTEHLA